MYEVNAHVLKMLTTSNWAPITQTALENLIEDMRYKAIIKEYIGVLKNSVRELEKYKGFNKENLLLVEYSLIYFYSTLSKYSNKVKELEEFCNTLYNSIDSNVNTDDVDTDTIFDNIEKGFCSFTGKRVISELGIKLDTESIIDIYNAWLHAHSTLCDFAKSLEDRLFDLHSDKWSRKVFALHSLTDKSSDGYTTSEPVDVIISFCNKITKYDEGTQKMISACLYNTKSTMTFDNRSFGFLYNFSPGSIVAMSPDDAQSSTHPYYMDDTLMHCLFRGTPIASIAKFYKISTLNLMTIYDFDEFKNKTFSYNEILIKDGTRPYGMLIFREAIDQFGQDVVFYCLGHRLPLFIRENDGRLTYVTVARLMKNYKMDI